MSNYDIYQDQTILVTGGTGSFGQSFVKFLLEQTQAKKMIVFSRDEYKQHVMAKEIRDPRVRFFLGDVRDLPRLERAFAGVDIMVHAAALKQVPALEYNPFEAVKTNVLGSQNVIEAAVNQKVKKILMVSTDKAAHPVNLYGATKLTAEKLFISGNSYSPHQSSFAVVRYGNVVGSRGSIVEILMQRADGEKLRLTDLEMTRFWISLEQSFELVTFAFTQMEGGEVFIPKVPSMRIVDLFEVIAPGVEKEIIGIRPGEKVHEVLMTEEESRHAYDLGSYYVVLPAYRFASDLYQRYELKKKVDPKFRFRSDTNERWLTKEELQALMSRARSNDPLRQTVN